MAEGLLSVGLDVGTTTTSLIVSRLQVENRAGGFAVPEMQITERQILYESPVRLTPLISQDRVDGQGIRRMVEEEYRNAGISREAVDTGAVIVTGETSRKENAGEVLQALSGFAGEFVVACAGPDLESILAAKGSGAAERSERTEKPVLHIDIGGGTSNFALLEDGKILATGCLNVGGRLLKFDTAGALTYVSPVLLPLTALRPGDIPTAAQVAQVAQLLAQGLEMAAGLRQRTDLLDALATREAGEAFCCTREVEISFSGGVADCIRQDFPPLAFGDMGPALGKAIRESRLCQGAYSLGKQTIRATVIGAGCHSARLSGSTVFFRGMELPVKNLPVARLEEEDQADPQAIGEKLRSFDEEMVVLAIPGYAGADYSQVQRLAEAIARGFGQRPVLVCLENDMAKALGHRLCLLLPKQRSCLCIDRLQLHTGSFLDIGRPVGPALPVVIKTLILARQEEGRVL